MTFLEQDLYGEQFTNAKKPGSAGLLSTFARIFAFIDTS